MTAFAVVDVETTGTRPDADRVIEVGVVRVERRRVVDRWRTFVRPDRPVPSFITRMTGIGEDDVREAPAFDEIAGDLARRLKGAVFVAHNAPFDSGFLRAEFARAGRPWTSPVVCTVRLARTLMPDLGGYSLDALASHFGILIENRHRALDDAAATAELLLRMLSVRRARTAISKQTAARKPGPLPDGAQDLPRSRGAWVLRDADGHALRAGRSVNLFETFPAEFADLPKRLAAKAARVDFEACESEIEAQAAQARFLTPPPSDHPFLTVTPDGRFLTGAPGPGRIFGPFRSARDLKIRLNRAKGLPLEDAIRRITAGLEPVGLLRRAPPSGPGMLVRQDQRLLWIQSGRLRKAWSLDLDEAEIRDDLRRLLDAPVDLESLPAVRASRGVPVEIFLGR
jgi:DNA polymerase III epsilon subunit family exonuclease